MTRAVLAAATVVAVYMPFCTPAVRPTESPQTAERRMSQLWHSPGDVTAADLFNGPWGADSAPDTSATYEYVKTKSNGVSPGVTVRDSHGVEWSVKQGPEGSVEVTLSRILSAAGYHQPPVFFLPTFTMRLANGQTRVEPGGRFRPHTKELKEEGDWSWQENPFVGTRPYQGLLTILMMVDSSDLKNSNNSRYTLKEPREGAAEWYVVRDIGTGLGETGRLDPRRNDPDIFAQHKFIIGVHDHFVEFDYHGWHQELVRDRITPADVHWAAELLAGLSAAQWADAFRAGGYEPDVAQRFIAKLRQKVDEGVRLE